MNYTSIWLKDIEDNNIRKLDRNLELDVLIIGGGITGLSTLYQLRNSNLKVALVDASLIGHGITGHTTGKITYLQELIYQDLVKLYSLDVAKLYLESQKDAIKEIINIINKEKIKCDLEQVYSYVYTDNKDEVKKVKREKEILTKLGCNVYEQKGKIDKINSLYAIKVDDTYVFHPLKYLYALKNICLKFGKEIYENTKIKNMEKINDKYICYGEDYKITAKRVIIACHYPFFLFPYFMPLKTYIEKSYITASPSKDKKYSLITAKTPSKSVRFQKDAKEYMLYLSNSSDLCNNIDEKENYNNVINDAYNLKLQPIYVWKNDDLITVDKLPYIGKLKKNNNDLLIGTGYNTWGMTNGTLASLILKDYILENENKYMILFDPLRPKPIVTIIKYLFNLWSSIKGFVESKIFKNKRWYSNNVEIKNINGKSVGIFKDDKEEYKVYNKCPHMGCSLIFNEKEKTWDCPCHASRFNIKGECIKGPSKYDITYKN